VVGSPAALLVKLKINSGLAENGADLRFTLAVPLVAPVNLYVLVVGI
jgi:hypothetical protein